jgi:hypothetical protein
MRIDDIKVGMEVYAKQKSIMPGTWEEFLHNYPNRITTVYSTDKSYIEIGTSLIYQFHLDDLVIWKSYNRKWKLLKPITIKSLRTYTQIDCAKFTHADLRRFVEELVKIDPCYVCEEISADVAQEIFIKIGLPNWLEDQDFIMKEKEQVNVNVITKVTVEERGTKFYIDITSTNGYWCLFEIYKNGSGFKRLGGMSTATGLKLTPEGKLYEIE